MATGFIETTHPLKKGEGTKLMCNRAIYNFGMNQHGHYVAEVLNPADYAQILSISAGYRPYQPEIDYPGLELPTGPVASAIPSTRATPPVINTSRKAPQKTAPRSPSQTPPAARSKQGKAAASGASVDPAAG